MTERLAVLARYLGPHLVDRMSRIVGSIPADEGGGSSLLKAVVLADLVVADGLTRVVEIGVYRGRLLLPMAAVLADIRRGEVVGIDPFRADDAVQRTAVHPTMDLEQWPRSVDWNARHDEVEAAIDAWGLRERARIIRARSLEVATAFPEGSIGLLHVDGNHDAAAVAEDVAAYLPAIQPGGYVVLDDVSWDGIAQVADDLRERHTSVMRLTDSPFCHLGGAAANDFEVFRVDAASTPQGVV